MSSSVPALGMFSVDTKLVVRTWDSWIAGITGVPAEEALGRPLLELLPGVAERGLLTVLRSTLDEGTVEVLAPGLHQSLIASPPTDPSSRLPQMRQRASIGPIREEGRITGALVTIEDVTARIEREQSLAQTADAIARAFSEQDWRARQEAVTQVAAQGQVVVDALVHTLREQHHNFNVLSSALDLLAITDLDVVEPLIGCLADDDADLRMQAALILGERRDARAIPALLRALDDPDTNVRFHAIEALGRLRATEAVEPIAAIAERRDFFLAFPAVQALSRLGDISIAPRLVPLLSDELLRAGVAEALGTLGDEVAAQPLVELLAEPFGPVEAAADALASLYERYQTRYGAGEQIATIVRRTATAAATQNLLDAAQRVTADRLRGIATVLGWLDGQAVQRALTRLLGHPTVRAQVVEALVRYGAGVVDLLVEQLQAEDLDTRQAAVVALGRIGDTRATPALIAGLADPELAVPAAGALARLGDGAAFEPLLALVGHPDAAVRQATIAALNSIGHPDMPSRVLTLLDDPSPLVRESAVKIAGYFGYASCVERVMDRCSDESEAVRRAAVEQLPFFEDPRTLAVLTEALAHDAAPVRAAAAMAFARVESSDAVEPLTRALQDEDAWVRYFALRSIGTFEAPAAAGAVRERLQRDPAGHVRLVALDVLGRLQPPDTLPVLEPLARAEDADTARAAIRALGHLRDPGAQPVLEALARADEPWRRLAAGDALTERGGTDSVFVLEWTAAADEDADVAQAAINGLAILAARDDENGTPATRALLALTKEPSKREPSIAALARLPVRRLADVAAGLQNHSTAVRRAAVEALSRMRHAESTRFVEAALDDPEASVRAAAAAELRRLGSRTATRKLVMLSRTDPDLEVRHAAMMAAGLERTA